LAKRRNKAIAPYDMIPTYQWPTLILHGNFGARAQQQWR